MKVADKIKFFEKSSKIGNNSNLQDSSSINNQKTIIKNPTYYNFIQQNDQKLLSKISDDIEIIKNKINLNPDLLKSKTKTIYKRHREDNCHGTVPIQKTKDNNYCVQIILKDTDDIKQKDYKDKKTENNIIILSHHQLKIVLYAIFNYVDTELDNKAIEKKLNDN